MKTGDSLFLSKKIFFLLFLSPTATRAQEPPKVTLERIVDARGQVLQYTYDALGRKISACYDLNGDGHFEDEFVEFFVNDSSWRAACGT